VGFGGGGNVKMEEKASRPLDLEDERGDFSVVKEKGNVTVAMQVSELQCESRNWNRE
jgi:hypothetical protein